MPSLRDGCTGWRVQSCQFLLQNFEVEPHGDGHQVHPAGIADVCHGSGNFQRLADWEDRYDRPANGIGVLFGDPARQSSGANQEVLVHFLDSPDDHLRLYHQLGSRSEHSNLQESCPTISDGLYSVDSQGCADRQIFVDVDGLWESHVGSQTQRGSLRLEGDEGTEQRNEKERSASHDFPPREVWGRAYSRSPLICLSLGRWVKMGMS